MNTRRKKLEKYSSSLNCDTLVTFEPENLFYLTGFWGEAIGVLEKGGQTTIIAPELEAERAREESINCDIITSQRGGLVSTLGSTLNKKKVCIDSQNYEQISLLKKSIPRLKQSPKPFHDARIIKDTDEIRILKKASSVIDQMFDLCTQTIKKGRRESELQAILIPLISLSKQSANLAGTSFNEYGSLLSYPDKTSSNNAASRTVRVIGPA